MLLTTPQICTRLNLDRKTLRKYIENEGFPCIRLTKYVYRYHWDDVLEWLRSRASGPLSLPAEKAEVAKNETEVAA